LRGIDVSVGTTVSTFTEKVARQLNGNLNFPMEDEELIRAEEWKVYIWKLEPDMRRIGQLRSRNSGLYIDFEQVSKGAGISQSV
jgi:hypothetical protein